MSKHAKLSHKVHMTQEKIDRYGKLNGDWDILHYDHDYCIKRGFRGTLAHGMHNMAPAVDLALEKYGKDFYYRGQVSVRWTGPVCPGDDQLTVLDEADNVVAQVSATTGTPANATVMVGKATLRDQ
jgi:acyl dehydratase